MRKNIGVYIMLPFQNHEPCIPNSKSLILRDSFFKATARRGLPRA